MQLDDIAKEIIVHLAKLDQTNVTINMEINAETTFPEGFTSSIQRIIKENTNALKKQLRFTISDFE
ncbi:MAG: hypothetical protein IJU37_06055 [Desulfovibrio sp.]|nr:hypothetical protein [Desulfovibrio sp.]